MKMRAFLMLVLLLSAPAAQAVYYSHVAATYGWIDPVAGSHTQAAFSNGADCTGGFSAPQDDDITDPVPIGFTFNFGGTNYTQLRIQTNGRLQFTSAFCGYGTETTGSPPTYPFDFPTGTPSSIGIPDMSNMIRVYGGDFDLDPNTGGGGTVYYATLGTAPNRTFVVTWYNVKEWNNPNTLFNAQVILYENGDFTFQYRDTLNFTNGHAQIGWEVSPTDYDVLSYSTLGSLAFTATRFYKTPTSTAQWHFDELAWSGGSDVVDSVGGYTGAAQHGASTIAASNAIMGNPGTCRYGQFDGSTQYIALPSTFPNLTQSFTVTAWIRTLDRTKAGQRIFIDDENNTGGYGFSLGDGGPGMLRFYSRGSSPVILDTGAVIQNNLWYFVVAEVDMAGGLKSMYVYNSAGTLLTSVSTAFTGWGTDAGNASIGGETDASGEAGNGFRFQGNLDEVQVFSGALPQTTLAALAIQTHLCPIQGASLGGFNAFDSSTAAGSVVGYIKTKIAGEPFTQSTGNIDIVALSGGLIDSTFQGTVSVQLVDASGGGTVDPLTGCGPWPVVATLASQTFDVASGGRISMSPVPQINNAVYPNLRVLVSDGAGRAGCSSDGFALRPASLLLADATHGDWLTAGTASALNNTSPTGGQVHRAWRYFTLQATGRDAQGNVLSSASGGYSGSPAGYAGAIVLPSAGTVGALETGAWSGTGTVTSNTARYGEVGAFALYLEDQSFAQIDAADTQPGDRYIPSNLDLIGRFVPDYFYVKADPSVTVPAEFETFGTTSTSCASRSFTYIGQPFYYLLTGRNPPQALVTARNAADATTVNYKDTLWKIVSDLDSTVSDVTTTYTANGPGIVVTAPGSGAQAPVVTSLNNGTGTVVASTTDIFTFTRSTTTPLSPFNAAINLTITVRDDSEKAVTGGQINTASSPTPTFSNIAFDAGNTFRYGRLRLMNASGSQVVSLPVPVEAQYWNGTAFITNTGDNCTAIPLATIAMGNYQKNLSAGKTVIQTPTAGTPLTLNGGTGFIRLSPPGTGNEGSVDVSVNLTAATAGASCTPGMPASTGMGSIAGATAGSWLQGAWCGTSYVNDPTARATFGIYTNTNLFIYQRENY